MRGTIIYDGLDLSKFGVYYDGSKEYEKPSKEMNRISIPGRNGDIFLPNNRWSNVPISYDCYIRDDFQANYNSLAAFLNSRNGYKVLETSGQPEEYRMAAFLSAIAPDMGQFNKTGRFALEFDCMPQRFLKSGAQQYTIPELSQTLTLTNPTQFDARPMITVEGNGVLTIGTHTTTVVNNTGGTLIDCEEMRCVGMTNMNKNITFSNHEYPVFKPGNNTVTYTGFTRVRISPRWWTL